MSVRPLYLFILPEQVFMVNVIYTEKQLEISANTW